MEKERKIAAPEGCEIEKVELVDGVAVVTLKEKERELEKQCVQLARRHGWDAWKNENNGNKGIPDYSFLKGGRFVMVEFKRSATARIRPEQLTWQARHPETVFFCHDIETFTKILEL